MDLGIQGDNRRYWGLMRDRGRQRDYILGISIHKILAQMVMRVEHGIIFQEILIYVGCLFVFVVLTQ